MTGQNEREAMIASLAARARCRQPLGASEISLGCHLCWSNAVSLLADVRHLVAGGRPSRVLSLTVLALEELAKSPLLFELDSNDDAERWKMFWTKEFSRHSPKQEAIGKYGKFLTKIGYGVYGLTLGSDTIAALDALKQWGFYVDCVDDAFQSPEEFATRTVEVVDLLFAVAEERADSFAQFHSSPERSAWIYSHRKELVTPGQFWPPQIRSEVELQGVLLSLASQYSITNPPDYSAFRGACRDLKEITDVSTFHGSMSAVGQTCSYRAQFRGLPTAGARAFSMLKLCIGAFPENQQSAKLKEWTHSNAAKKERKE